LHHGGDVETARACSVEAAAAALNRGALAEASKFYELALMDAEIPLEPALLHDAGRCELLRCRPREGIRLLRRAEEDARRRGEPRLSARCAILRLEAESEVGLAGHEAAAEELAVLGRAALSRSDHGGFLSASEAFLRVTERTTHIGRVRNVLTEVAEALGAFSDLDRCRGHMLLALNIFYGTAAEALSHARKAIALADASGEKDLRVRSIHRLYVVLVFLGLGESEEAATALTFLLEHSETVGDVRLRYTAMANRGVWLMEAGAYAEAYNTLRTAGATLPQTARGEQLNCHANLAEACLSRGEFEEAYRLYQMAETWCDGGTREFLRDIVTAGTGLSALRLGHLSHARACYDALREWDRWFFDPGIIIRFRAHWLARLGKQRIALSLIEEEASGLRDRYPSIWLRLQLFQGRFSLRHRQAFNRAAVKDAVSIAEDLGLAHRRRQLLRILS
jgi:tetratricopeptide (TPR) repeat protein